MVLDAQCQCNLAAGGLPKDGTDAVLVVIGSVGERFEIESRTPRFGSRVRVVIVIVARLLAQVVIFEALLCAWIIETSAAYEIGNKK